MSAAGVDRNVAVIVHFAPNFLGGALWDSPEFAAIADLLHRSRRGIAFDDPPNELVRELRGLGNLAPARRTAALLGTLQSLTEHPAQRRLASLGYSPELDGTSPQRIDAVCRFLHTCRLLVETELPIIEVASASGYRNLSYFNRRFLRRTGMAPRHYRAHYGSSSERTPHGGSGQVDAR